MRDERVSRSLALCGALLLLHCLLPLSHAIEWTTLTSASPWAARYAPGFAYHNSKFWIAGGITGTHVYNDVWSSPDAVTWTLVTATGPWSAGGGAYNPALVGVTGSSPVLMTFGGQGDTVGYMQFAAVSTDGVTWTTRTPPWPARSHVGFVQVSGVVYLAGGSGTGGVQYNDVWKTADAGVSWQQLTANAAWGIRNNMGFTHISTGTYAGTFVLCGGVVAATMTYMTDVWTSADAITWTRVSSSAPWSARSNPVLISALSDSVGPELVLTGGMDDTIYYGDQWRSTNGGATWTLVANSPGNGYGPRAMGKAVVANGGVYVAAGYNGTAARNDVIVSYGYASYPTQWVQSARPASTGGSTPKIVALRVATDPSLAVLYTFGSYAVSPSAYGGSDLYVQKWHANGTRIWAAVAGTTGEDQSGGIAVDPATGESFIVGSVNQPGLLPGLCPTKSDTTFTTYAIKYSAAGVAVKCVYLDGNYLNDVVFQANAGGTGTAAVYACGYTSAPGTGVGQPYMMRLNPSTLATVWSRPYGSAVSAVAYQRMALSPVDNTAIWVCGLNRYQSGQFGAADMMFQKVAYNDGSVVWNKYYGSSAGDECYGLAFDAEGTYLYGTGIYGAADNSFAGLSYAGGTADMIMVKLNTAGSMVWAKGLGTSVDDRFGGQTFVGPDGNIYAGGATQGAFAPAVNIGSANTYDTILTAYYPNGTRASLAQVSGAGDEYMYGMSPHPDWTSTSQRPDFFWGAYAYPNSWPGYNTAGGVIGRVMYPGTSYTVDACASNPCANTGTCVSGTNGWSCACRDGWSGATCSSAVDECASNPCRNGGTCVDGLAAFTCSCAAGYSGAVCQTEINNCLPNPCKHGGACVTAVGTYACQCSGYWLGVNCTDIVAPSVLPTQWVREIPGHNLRGSTKGLQAVKLAGITYVFTAGSYNPLTNSGSDIRVRKWTRDGEVVWTTTFGTTDEDGTGGMAVTASGEVWLAGQWRAGGAISGLCPAKSGSDLDGFLVRLNADGTPVFCTSAGMQTFGADDNPYAMTYHVTGSATQTPVVYVTGDTDASAFLVQYDGVTGAMLWKISPGYNSFWAVTPAPSTSEFYACGAAYGTGRGGADWVIQKYQSDGGLLWTTYVGSSGTDVCLGLTVDASDASLYAIGNGGGSTHEFAGQPYSGLTDAAVAKLSPTGNILWTRLFGSSGYDDAGAGVVGPNKVLYFTGTADGNVVSGASAGDLDFFSAAYYPNGTRAFLQQIGTPALEHGNTPIAIDPDWTSASASPDLYMIAYTLGAWPGYPSFSSPVLIHAAYNTSGSTGTGNACASNPCVRGVCSEQSGALGWSCACSDGSTGLHCDQDVDECASAPCMNGAACVNLTAAFRCDCLPGFEGWRCETDLDECASNPCPGGSQCVDGINGYACQACSASGCQPSSSTFLAVRKLEPAAFETGVAVGLTELTLTFGERDVEIVPPRVIATAQTGPALRVYRVGDDPKQPRLWLPITRFTAGADEDEYSVFTAALPAGVLSQPNTQYRVTLTAGAFQSRGSRRLSSGFTNSTWSFTTALAVPETSRSRATEVITFKLTLTISMADFSARTSVQLEVQKVVVAGWVAKALGVATARVECSDVKSVDENGLSSASLRIQTIKAVGAKVAATIQLKPALTPEAQQQEASPSALYDAFTSLLSSNTSSWMTVTNGVGATAALIPPAVVEPESEPFPWLLVIAVASGAVLTLVLAAINWWRYPDAKASVLLLLYLTVLDFGADMSFVSDLAADKENRFAVQLWLTVAVLGLNVLFNMAVTLLHTTREIRHSNKRTARNPSVVHVSASTRNVHVNGTTVPEGAFTKWLYDNLGVVGFVTILCLLDLDSVEITTSRMFAAAPFSGPWRPETIDRFSAFALFAVVFKDIPRFAIKLAVLSRTGSTSATSAITLLSLAATALMILRGLTVRALRVYRVGCGCCRADTAAAGAAAAESPSARGAPAAKSFGRTGPGASGSAAHASPAAPPHDHRDVSIEMPALVAAAGASAAATAGGAPSAAAHSDAAHPPAALAEGVPHSQSLAQAHAPDMSAPGDAEAQAKWAAARSAAAIPAPA